MTDSQDGRHGNLVVTETELWDIATALANEIDRLGGPDDSGAQPLARLHQLHSRVADAFWDLRLPSRAARVRG